MTATETAPPEVDEVDGLPTLSPVADAGSEDQPVFTPRTSHVVLRRVEPWSVFKLSLVFYLCVCLVLLVAGIILWLGASATGVVGNIEGFFQDAGFDGFTFSAGTLLRGFALGGLVLVVAGTIANLLLATLFNLMSDVVGGIRVTLGEDVRPPTDPSRPRRR
ncbi:MAG: hypothetical protein JWO68_2468 [Actinomycetia bacterium]|nr:hypothetical protein [Actinomycetes bacterium]